MCQAPATLEEKCTWRTAGGKMLLRPCAAAQLSEKTAASFNFQKNFSMGIEKKKVQHKLMSYFNIAE